MSTTNTKVSPKARKSETSSKTSTSTSSTDSTDCVSVLHKSPPQLTSPLQRSTRKVATKYDLVYIISRLLTPFVFWFMILGLPLYQIAVISTFSDPKNVILTIAQIQAVLSAVGALALGWYCPTPSENEKHTKKIEERCQTIWCGPCFNFKSMFMGGFTVYYLPIWFLVNQFYSIRYEIVGIDKLAVIFPILIYLPFLFCGAQLHALSKEYELIESKNS
jgi:hypothetical protein